MSFEELDKKIRDAADMHQPSYNEKAWTKMEHLLDKHLPEKKDHKKRFIFWMIAFLISTSILMIWLNSDDSKQPALSKAEQESVPNKLPPVIQQENKLNKADPQKLINKPAGTEVLIRENNTTTDIHSNKKITPGQPFYTGNTNNIQDNSLLHPLSIAPGQSKNANTYLLNATNSERPGQLPAEKMNAIILSNKNILQKYFNGDRRADIPSIIPPAVNNESIFGKKSFAQKFSIAVSAGPSISSVGMNNPGRITAQYGSHIKYALNNKWTIGTGFFMNKKVYAAGKDDYRPPAGYWTYYADLLNIDADCDVYEIPLTISYSIKEAGKHEWLASAGVSSYFMKKETYDYQYKNQAGQVLYREWTIKSNNIHHFSALTLSAGYKHQINQRTSILIEPNIKVPLKGVGYGKVKFYNAGTMISLQVKPFAKK